MLPIVTLSTHLLLLMSLISGVHSVDPPITCEAGTFTAGEPASVICNFRTNITATMRSIAMTRYPPHAPKHSRGKDVLLCSWLSEEKKHDCSIEMANYTFDTALTDHLTVRIPAVNAEQVGLYMCYFVPPEETQAHSCELRVQGS
ncbi:uncharacterized protein [Littorina saxatilis]|uniref:uncharacterized protein isoform X2 n=1 Tax=Littorina saxatilis TaxID=31220 RepID=UPI0038B490D4